MNDSQAQVDPQARYAKQPRKSVFIVAAAVLFVALGLGAYEHFTQNGRAADAQSNQLKFVPEVRTTVVKADTAPITLHLPGQTNPFDQARLYARVNGYVQKWYTDIGTRVHANELLAKIDSPDLDQQLAQARADVLTAAANLRTSTLTAERSRALNQTQDVSNQTYDVSRGNASAANSTFQAAVANVHRFEALVSYQNIAAPFDGVVTTRNIDIGDLVTSDSKDGTPLFTVQRDDVLRVVVYVPQSRALELHDGMNADVTLMEMPGKVFHGTVARSSVALDPSSRTLLTEVDVPNQDHVLRAGLYVQVSFSIPPDAPVIDIPADAIIFGQDGLEVAVVNTSDHVRFHSVVIRKDLGTSVQLRSGLSVGDTIVVDPPVGLVDGEAVHQASSTSDTKSK